ncbi:MAG: response regulator [Magnetococcales bacterium]|nr:response regulator [Magnetococcales bacterium]
MMEAIPRSRVLVVEDDVISRQLVEVMLRNWSLEVVAVSSGQEALERFVADRFDLIFLDIHMAGLNGYETCLKIREYEKVLAWKAIPIIALTGSVLPEDKARGRSVGMNDFLEKPLRIKNLQAILHHWLGSVAPSVPVSSFEESGVEVDLQILEVLRVELSKVPGAFAKILGMFLVDLHENRLKLQRASEALDQATLFRIAHSMKSQCGAVGASSLRAVFIQIEQRLKSDHLEDIPGLLAQVDAICLTLIPRLERIRDNPDISLAMEVS